jgi:hypothetical protein
MTKLIIAATAFASMTDFALALGSQPSPGPLLGAVAGPWGLAASFAGYSLYRVIKSRR